MGEGRKGEDRGKRMRGGGQGEGNKGHENKSGGGKKQIEKEMLTWSRAAVISVLILKPNEL